MYRLGDSRSKRSIDVEMDEAGEILGLLSDTFGPDDPGVKEAIQTYNKMITRDNPTVVDYAVGNSFLKWVKSKPSRVTKPSLSRCRCNSGFVVETTDPMTCKPCDKCLPEAYAKWADGEGVDDEF